jgi:NF-X1-type zinc finger protein NFXL1
MLQSNMIFRLCDHIMSAIGVLSRTLANYLELLEGEGDGNHPALNLLQLTTSWSCLVCLSTVRRVDAVWNCDQCGCMMHLVCVQQWAKDSLSLPPSPSPLSPHLFPATAATRTWSCPKCRKDYIHSEIPTLYYCFCRKKVYLLA